MQHALSAPVFKSIALAGLGLALGIGASRGAHAPKCTAHRLSLHAVDRPDEIYLSAFRDGPIRVCFEGSKLHGVTFKTFASAYDGCRWLGIEKLTVRDAHSFDYDYSEHILDCDPGATPARKTPRQGVVTVDD